MVKLSMLAFHPVKMQSCYEKMETLNLEGLQQRCDVSSPSVFIQRAQILMRQVSCLRPTLFLSLLNIQFDYLKLLEVLQCLAVALEIDLLLIIL